MRLVREVREARCIDSAYSGRGGEGGGVGQGRQSLSALGVCVCVWGGGVCGGVRVREC